MSAIISHSKVMFSDSLFHLALHLRSLGKGMFGIFYLKNGMIKFYLEKTIDRLWLFFTWSINWLID